MTKAGLLYTLKDRKLRGGQGESCFGSLSFIPPLLTNLSFIWGCSFPNLMSIMDPYLAKGCETQRLGS